MGCIKSKEDKGPAMKYRTDNTPEPISSHVSHYGSDSSQATQSPAIKGSAVNFNSHSMTPFGGPSGMTPFGGASSSFSAVPSPYPSTLTGEYYIQFFSYYYSFVSFTVIFKNKKMKRMSLPLATQKWEFKINCLLVFIIFSTEIIIQPIPTSEWSLGAGFFGFCVF